MDHESWVLDGYDFNDPASTLFLESVECPPPKPRQAWISGPDSSGAELADEIRWENREWSAKIRVAQQASMDDALEELKLLVARLQEAPKLADGLELIWTPAASSRPGTLYVLAAEIDDIPVEVTGDDAGWFIRSPVVSLKLICRPFIYGTEQVNLAVVGTGPLMTLTVPAVPGDVPAEGRLIVTDTATQTRRTVEWGLEQRHYNSATSLTLDSDGLVTTGFAGTGSALTGAYDPNASGNSTIYASLYSMPIAVCGTGNLSHVGTFRVKARIYTNTLDVRARLAWQEGDGPFRANPYASAPVASAFSEIDLGLISVPPKELGTQRWTGRIEAYGNVGDYIYVDYLLLIPAGEGYGRVRSPFVYRPSTAIQARDEFTTTTTGGALNARVSPLGGTWVTSGAATDLVFADAPVATDETATRSVSSAEAERYAILGTATYTDVEASARIYSTVTLVMSGVICRWTNSSNCLVAELQTNGSPINLAVIKYVAGVATYIGTAAVPWQINTWYSLRLIAYASGLCVAQCLDANGSTLTQLSAIDTVLATGGTLATGKVGFSDRTAGAAGARYFDNFYAATPTPDPIALYSGRSLEIRSDATIRQDSTGTYYGPAPAYRGSRFHIPPAGPSVRTSRIAIKAHRGDTDANADAPVTDALTAQVAFKPRYLAIPG